MAYFANSTEGDILEQQCETCPAEKDPESFCPIHAIQSLYNYEQLRAGNENLEAAMNMLIGENGLCKMKPLINIKVIKRTDEPPAWLSEDSAKSS